MKRHMQIQGLLRIAALAGLCALAIPGHSAAPLKIVWPYPAGGDVDGVLRLMAEQWSADQGRPVLVDNKLGAAGLIAMQVVHTAPMDGNTLLAAPMGTMALLPLVRKLPLNPLDAFVPVCQFAETGGFVFTGKHLGFKNFNEFVTYARQNPGKLSYASSGIGTQVHVVAEMMQKKLNIKMLHVPYKGPTESINDLIAGRVDVMFEPAAVPFAQSGKIDILASLSDKMPPGMPPVPSGKEVGMDGLPAAWFGLFVRKGTASQEVAALEKGCAQVVNHPNFMARMKSYQARPTYRSGSDLMTIWQADFRSQADVVRSLNLPQEN